MANFYGNELTHTDQFFRVDAEVLAPSADSSTWGLAVRGLDKHRAVAWGAPKGRPPARQPAANVTHAVFGCQDGYGIYTPLDKATSDGTILANPTNGSGLHVSHGYPFREVVPWYCGEMNAKWVTEVELIDHEYLGSWQRGGWSNDAK